ncbi:MAG: DUF6600 domain-containing protein [Hyphomicrobium sp.]
MTIATKKIGVWMLSALCAVLAAGLIAPSPARAETSVAVQYFYDPMLEHGVWVQDPDYGWVWYPASRGPDWRPYYRGRWVHTSEYGWYWDSYEPWGWAAYHYGRWVFTVTYGWVWVPDDEWGPGWAEWRYGGGYVGWQPMPPRRKPSSSGASVSASAQASGWVFVDQASFASGDLEGRALPSSKSAAAIEATTRVTNYATVNGVVVNRSLDVAKLSAATKIAIKPVALSVTETLASGVGARTAGRIAVYRPLISTGGAVRAKQELDLDVPPTDLDARIDASGAVDVEAPRAPSVSGSAAGEFETGISRDLDIDGRGGAGVGLGGGGVGIGGGGGLRIGR